jgi:hypothetical protein
MPPLLLAQTTTPLGSLGGLAEHWEVECGVVTLS